MMAIRRRLDMFTKGRIVGMLESSRSQTGVSRILNVVQSVISRLWQRFQRKGDVTLQPVSGSITRIATFMDNVSEHVAVTELEVKLKKIDQLQRKIEELKELLFGLETAKPTEEAEFEEDLYKCETRLDDLEDSREEALFMSRHAKNIMKEAGMEMRKWISNDTVLMTQWGAEGFDTHPMDASIRLGTNKTKVLGMAWQTLDLSDVGY
ncbi:transposable element Tcb2 transposase [Trichonephila clavipes]|nr:transposable element Tcb2 transposase [Trichonephila clavipes]